jgi:hypothetical protein
MHCLLRVDACLVQRPCVWYRYLPARKCPAMQNRSSMWLRGLAIGCTGPVMYSSSKRRVWTCF